MMIRKKRVIVALSIATVAFLLGTVTMTAQGGWREYLELWEAIHRIQEALEARTPKKGYVSVPAAAVDPMWNLYDTVNRGNYIWNKETTQVIVYAPVQLPHGTIITKLTIYWKDEGAERVLCRLWVSRHQSYDSVIARAASPWTSGPGFGSSYEVPGYAHTVDNSQYTYFLEVIIPPFTSDVDYYFHYACIEYEYPA